MKILHVINNLGSGGAEKLLVELLPKFDGIQVDLLLLNGNKTLFYSELQKKFNGNIFSLGNGSIYNPCSIFKIKKYYKDYDIIHAHLFPVLYWVALAKFISFSKVNLIFTEHSTSNKRLNNIIFRQFDKFIYRFYSKIIAITPAVQIVLKEKLNISSQKCVVIYNGVDLNSVSLAKKYDKSDFFNDDKSVLLIQVSRFSKEKDQQTTIRSLQYLPLNVKLLLVGEGDLRGECEKLVQVLKLEERIKFLGLRMDVPKLLKTADIVVQSSHWEGFGLVAVEGMAAGKPVIVSNVSGLREVVAGAGILFEKENEKDLAKKIIKFLNDEAYYNETVNAGLQIAKKYNIDFMIERQLDLYYELLN